MTRGRSGGTGEPRRERNESGFSLVMLVASIAVMLILMGAAVPTWRYVMKNDREEELYFRGDQIARAIERYQRKNGNSLPVSMELLVKDRYLRKAYTDPMTKDGKWRIVRPGEAMMPAGGPPGGGPPGAGGRPGGRPGMPRPPRPGQPSLGVPGGAGPIQGAILGVASTSTEKSLKLFNGRTRYDQWVFMAGQPRVLGGTPTPAVLPGGIGASPSPSPRGGIGTNLPRP